MAARKPIKGALVGIAGAVAAGVIALQTGAAAEAAQFVQNVIRRLLPRDSGPRRMGKTRDRAVRSPDRRKIVVQLACNWRVQALMPFSGCAAVRSQFTVNQC
jgi:hypothetical protein